MSSIFNDLFVVYFKPSSGEVEQVKNTETPEKQPEATSNGLELYTPTTPTHLNEKSQVTSIHNVPQDGSQLLNENTRKRSNTAAGTSQKGKEMAAK